MRIVAFMILALAGSAAWAQDYVEGVHYQRLPVSVATADSAKVEVVEVFSYACNHCNEFDPLLELWRHAQAEGVHFRRLPANFNNPVYTTLARAFYTAEALGVLDAVHTPIFSGIHDRGIDLSRTELLAALFEEMADVAPDDFTGVFNSFGIGQRTQQARAQGLAYGVRGVPSMIVDGKYRVDATMVRGFGEMLAVVDYLVGLQATAKGVDVTPLEAASAD